MTMALRAWGSDSFFGSGFLEGNDAVEYELTADFVRLGCLIDAEVADTLELEAVELLRVAEVVPDAGVLVLNQRVLVEEVCEVASPLGSSTDHVLFSEQVRVLIDDSRNGVLLGHPLDHTLHLLLGHRDRSDLDFLDGSVGRPDDLLHLDEGAVPEADHLAWHDAKEAFADLLREVFAVHEQVRSDL